MSAHVYQQLDRPWAQPTTVPGNHQHGHQQPNPSPALQRYIEETPQEQPWNSVAAVGVAKTYNKNGNGYHMVNGSQHSPSSISHIPTVDDQLPDSSTPASGSSHRSTVGNLSTLGSGCRSSRDNCGTTRRSGGQSVGSSMNEPR